MLQVLVAGFIALASKWLLDGGIRRRDRHMIREELELAGLLGDRPEADQLRASAEARLQRYLRPPFSKRAAPALRTAGVVGVALILGGSQLMTGIPDDASRTDKLLLGIAIGVTTATFAQALQVSVERWARQRAQRPKPPVPPEPPPEQE